MAAGAQCVEYGLEPAESCDVVGVGGGEERDARGGAAPDDEHRGGRLDLGRGRWCFIDDVGVRVGGVRVGVRVSTRVGTLGTLCFPSFALFLRGTRGFFVPRGESLEVVFGELVVGGHRVRIGPYLPALRAVVGVHGARRLGRRGRRLGIREAPP